MSELQIRKELVQARMLTRRGNALASTLMIMFVGFVGLTALAVAMDGSDEGYTCAKTKVQVRQGDTVSGIVKANCKGNLLKAIDDVVDERGSATLMPTEYITLPAEG